MTSELPPVQRGRRVLEENRTVWQKEAEMSSSSFVAQDSQYSVSFVRLNWLSMQRKP